MEGNIAIICEMITLLPTSQCTDVRLSLQHDNHKLTIVSVCLLTLCRYSELGRMQLPSNDCRWFELLKVGTHELRILFCSVCRH